MRRVIFLAAALATGIAVNAENVNPDVKANTSKYAFKTPKTEKAVVGAYKEVVKAVVGGYKTVEWTVVDAYKKIEEKFVTTFLSEKGVDEIF